MYIGQGFAKIVAERLMVSVLWLKPNRFLDPDEGGQVGVDNTHTYGTPGNLALSKYGQHHANKSQSAFGYAHAGGGKTPWGHSTMLGKGLCIKAKAKAKAKPA